MTTAQVQTAFRIADSDIELSEFATDLFDGFGQFEFSPVVATVQQLAWLIRWQARQLDGQWDSEALTEVQYCLRRKCTIVGA